MDNLLCHKCLQNKVRVVKDGTGWCLGCFKEEEAESLQIRKERLELYLKELRKKHGEING